MSVLLKSVKKKELTFVFTDANSIVKGCAISKGLAFHNMPLNNMNGFITSDGTDYPRRLSSQ